MVIKTFVVGPLESNCYLIVDEHSKETLVVDPGDEPDWIIEYVHNNNLHVKHIVCTHAHFDHVSALSDIKKETGASIIIHQDERETYRRTREQAVSWGFELDELPEPDILVSEGDVLEIGSLKFVVIHTPGHSPGGICLSGEDILITGDTLFAGAVGRTDLHGGDMMSLKKSFKRLMSLSEKTRVLPGHGPETTIGREKKENFFSLEIM